MSLVIAIDGPAASGKSSVARMLAAKYGWLYVNSGAMYRAVAWSVVREGIDPTEEGAVLAHLDGLNIECTRAAGESGILIGGVDPGGELRSAEVNDSVSAVSRIAGLRSVLVDRQREYAEAGDIVMEGRDIGSVVFPDTPYKFYIDASEEVRDARRRGEGQTDKIGERDRMDASRKVSPLVVAEDAQVIDSSHLTLEGVVGEVIGRLKLMGLPIEL